MGTAHYRAPKASDATDVQKLVQNTPELDDNSWYYYALMFDHFRDTCLIAEADGVIHGFVIGYLKPTDRDTLFLWQTATSLTHGVPNMGLTLLTSLINRLAQNNNIRYIEATTDPNNKAINMQFRLLSRYLNSDASTSIFLDSAQYSQLDHDEQLVKIGPLQ